MSLTAIDHVAIPTARPEEMIVFYRGLGFAVLHEEAFRQGRGRLLAFALGDFKINVHLPTLWQDPAFTLRGRGAVPGGGDLCFVWQGAVEDLKSTLSRAEAAIIEGPVPRQGGRAAGTTVGTSVYTRDPDGNLLEFIVYA